MTSSIVSGMHYEPVLPAATYAPWRDDPEFGRVHAALAGHTLVDRYRCGEHADTSEEVVSSLLARLQIENAQIVKGIFPDDSADAMADEQFCFVHVDVDVFHSAQDVVEFAWPRMPVGVVVVFDGYGFVSCDGIPKLLRTYRGRPDRLVLHNLNGHAVVVKTRD